MHLSGVQPRLHIIFYFTHSTEPSHSLILLLKCVIPPLKYYDYYAAPWINGSSRASRLVPYTSNHRNSFWQHRIGEHNYIYVYIYVSMYVTIVIVLSFASKPISRSLYVNFTENNNAAFITLAKSIMRTRKFIFTYARLFLVFCIIFKLEWIMFGLMLLGTIDVCQSLLTRGHFFLITRIFINID